MLDHPESHKICTNMYRWGPAFGVRANTVAFGHILTRLTAAKEAGAFVTTPDGTKVALGQTISVTGGRNM
jgi:3-oxoacyl-[acyl-carrier protein] reductase